MSNDASQTPRTATEAYRAVRINIARLLDVLDMELDKHAERARADAENWGYAEALHHVRSDLIDIVAFLSGQERSGVDAFLNDAI